MSVDDARDQSRVFRMDGRMVGFLICGEMLARSSDQRLGKTLVTGADLVIDIAHADIKIGNWHRTWSAAIRGLGGRTKRPVAMAQHLDSERVASTVKWYADKDGPKRLVNTLKQSKARATVADGTDTDRIRAYVDFYDA
ncbi:MAG TPA: hypothetical protein VHK47_01995 [Polyangia bacterium]|nr:hypothetical protein [Polyangia bacterium]